MKEQAIKEVSGMRRAQCLERRFSKNYGAELIVCRVGYAKDTAMDTVLDGTAEPERVYMSADGRCFDTSQWHQGESAGDVYVEIERENGRDFHGWVDAESRKLVQAG